ncbi:MAG: bifunctional riboflavin kinase/FAD synthetase [Candidatus Cloacimonetes bacterium]|nr:bifunctional riboflavin kinase/FAD synthetase [Candidatus Cloacimonadota bacterium]
MNYILNKQNDFRYSLVTMGTFDGVHLGHQSLLKRLVQRARESRGESVVITYLHHPLETIHRMTFPYLLTEHNVKERLLRELGVDNILYLDFSSELADMEPLDFLQSIILGEVKARELVVGYDTHFGHNREGNKAFLEQHKQELGYRLEIVKPFTIDNRIVSSSVIRDLIREGNMQETERLLGRRYSLSGRVVSGHKIGRGIGFPTINIQPAEPNKLIPAIGVYITTLLVDGGEYRGITNIGYSPSLKRTRIQEIEMHIFDFKGNLYNCELEIFFHLRLRNEFQFATRQELINQINLDTQAAREYFTRQKQPGSEIPRG